MRDCIKNDVIEFIRCYDLMGSGMFPECQTQTDKTLIQIVFNSTLSTGAKIFNVNI